MKASKEIIWIKSVSFAAVQRGAMIQVILSKLFFKGFVNEPGIKGSKPFRYQIAIERSTR
jgi:hypothetical protein